MNFDDVIMCAGRLREYAEILTRDAATMSLSDKFRELDLVAELFWSLRSRGVPTHEIDVRLLSHHSIDRLKLDAEEEHKQHIKYLKNNRDRLSLRITRLENEFGSGECSDTARPVMTVGELRVQLDDFEDGAPIVLIVDDDVSDCDLTDDTLVIDQCARTGCDPEGCAIVLRAATPEEIKGSNATGSTELAVIDGGKT